MQIDVNTLICANFQLSVDNYGQGWLVLHLSRIDKVSKIDDIFFLIFHSTLIIRKRFLELKFSTLVEQLLPDCLGKFNKFNVTNLIIDLTIKIFLMIFFLLIATKRPKYI